MSLRLSFAICSGVLSSILAGCYSVTPRQNFINMMNAEVGKRVADLRPYLYPPESMLISSTALPNGNVEKRYKPPPLGSDRRVCIHIYEIDPKTDVIIRAEGEGAQNTDTDCVAPP